MWSEQELAQVRGRKPPLPVARDVVQQQKWEQQVQERPQAAARATPVLFQCDLDFQGCSSERFRADAVRTPNPNGLSCRPA